jgi:hypothetical protein
MNAGNRNRAARIPKPASVEAAREEEQAQREQTVEEEHAVKQSWVMR